MSLREFETAFTSTSIHRESPHLDWQEKYSQFSDFEFLAKFSGHSFNHGVYRIHTPSTARVFNEEVRLAFPEHSESTFCFGFDWLGRQFSLDPKRTKGDQPLVLMFEPGTGEVFEVPSTFKEFHNVELTDYAEEALALGFFHKWLEEGNRPPEFHECVGYKTPLFLGGEDTTDNLELCDSSVYWHVSAQLVRKTKGLKPGTVISRLDII